MILKSSCFALREESAGRAEHIASVLSDKKTTSPHLRPHQGPFSSREELTRLVLHWCLALKGERCWLSMGRWDPGFQLHLCECLTPQVTLSWVLSSMESWCNKLQGNSFSICNLFQPKPFDYLCFVSINTDSMGKLKSQMCMNTAFKST